MPHWSLLVEKHTLQYEYTALSTPDTFSGSVFSGVCVCVCVCDDRQISHYCNEEQDWKKSEIWRDVPELHESRDWFLHQLYLLSNCTNSKCSELHVLQRRAGCEVEKLPDGTIKNPKGFDEYQYDGEDFIVFNFNTTQWINKNPKAKETKLKWDSQTIRNQIIKDELKNCMNWISTFNNTQRKEL
ncbi:zinc-alpha-2-glycoprotein-like [Myxocyprinus asiaticus]|uniref:zinc-alpha-2-glycoprotein-like n=1 Tax=Myxocyprinus asiaticus TaxID=70543 RepID=UPI002222FF81|nr:zinc-alpha-2-glycoprotein-like [Myxocyprinus asiaticus]